MPFLHPVADPPDHVMEGIVRSKNKKFIGSAAMFPVKKSVGDYFYHTQLKQYLEWTGENGWQEIDIVASTIPEAAQRAREVWGLDYTDFDNRLYIVRNPSSTESVTIEDFGVIVPPNETIEIANYDDAVLSKELTDLIIQEKLIRVVQQDLFDPPERTVEAPMQIDINAYEEWTRTNHTDKVLHLLKPNGKVETITDWEQYEVLPNDGRQLVSNLVYYTDNTSDIQELHRVKVKYYDGTTVIHEEVIEVVFSAKDDKKDKEPAKKEQAIKSRFDRIAETLENDE